MSHYISFTAAQEPFPVGEDNAKRTMFSVNFEVKAAAPLGYFEGEVSKLLKDAGLATGVTPSSGGDTQIGPSVSLPATGTIISILNSGGMSPLDTHDGQRIHRLSLQIIVRALSYPVGRERIQAIWQRLHGLRNTTVDLTA